MIILRWICENCKKKWIYPIEKCIYCKGEIKKQKGTKLKVIGITKVMIPSPMHPIIPYNILLLEDEHGNKQPKKTMGNYKIGEEYAENKAKEQDAVSVVKIKYDIYEAIRESLDLLEIQLEEKEKILIKPSIISAAYPYQAITTNPDFLDALLKVLFDFGAKRENIIVAEQALIGYDAADAAAKSGILGICKKHGIEFIDISKLPKDKFEELEAEGYKFKIYKEAIGRTIINAPVMKTNFQIGISGALENLTRLADEETQRKMYYDGIEETLPKLANIFKNLINVADASNGMQGQGPLALGEPAFLNLVLASRNASSLDSAFCEIAMIEKPKFVAGNSEIVGNEIDALKYPLKQPNPEETPHPDIKVVDGKACPACLGLLYGLTTKLIGLRGQQIHVLIGSQFGKSRIEGKRRLIALGDCASKKLDELGIKDIPKIQENLDGVEQAVLLKKLLTTGGQPSITPVDKVKSKMSKLFSKVIS